MILSQIGGQQRSIGQRTDPGRDAEIGTAAGSRSSPSTFVVASIVPSAAVSINQIQSLYLPSPDR